MFKEREGRNCWEVEAASTPRTDTFANAIKMKNKMVFCKNCLFYGYVNEIPYEMIYPPLKGITRS